MADWLDSELNKGERVLWRGQPTHQLFLFRPLDIFAVPFSIIWLSAVLFAFQVPHRGPVPFILIQPLFLVIGLHMLIGRFLVDQAWRRRTQYAVTSQRVLMRTGLFTQEVRTAWLSSLPEMSCREWRDLRGTILFGQRNAMDVYASTGAMFPGGRASMLAFEGIEDVKRVQRLIQDARQTATAH